MEMLKLQKYSFGMGDRFGRQGEAQLQAVLNARADGIDVYPTWNKSYREHSTVKTVPDSLRRGADAAVTALGWEDDYYVDADHIGLKTVDGFLAGSNFYTLDVADFVGQSPDASDMESFLSGSRQFLGECLIPGVEEAFTISEDTLRQIAGKYLAPIKAAKAIYARIAASKGADAFVTEVSIDETDQPQSPAELLLILSMIAAEGIPVQTIAPKFTGRFNKGVDYVGDLTQFEKEFDEDLHVIAYAVETFGLPDTLKLSVHSGSDKFSLYPIIRKLIRQHDAGLHVKTAGTTWLEEVIGLAEAGGEALDLVKEIYAEAYNRFDELTTPYATVIDIVASRLPKPEEVASWGSETYANSLRHVPDHPLYNPHFRQLLHVGYKVAGEKGARFTEALEANAEIVGRNVTKNLEERHIRQIF